MGGRRQRWEGPPPETEPLVKRRNQVTANENESEVFLKRQGVSVPCSKEGM